MGSLCGKLANSRDGAEEATLVNSESQPLPASHGISEGDMEIVRDVASEAPQASNKRRRFLESKPRWKGWVEVSSSQEELLMTNAEENREVKHTRRKIKTSTYAEQSISRSQSKERSQKAEMKRKVGPEGRSINVHLPFGCQI